MILKELRAEALNLIKVHSTVGSLRRACSVGDTVVVEATETMPRLYYVTANGVESVHALNSDLVKFLISNHLIESGAEKLYSLTDVDIHWIRTEDDYNKFIHPDYRKQYDWEQSKATMPWLSINFNRPEVDAESTASEDELDEDAEATAEVADVEITVAFASPVNLKSTVDAVGTVSGDRKSVKLTNKKAKYLLLEAVNDMGLTGAVEVKVTVDTPDISFTNVIK